jgi:hypothetical protein
MIAVDLSRIAAKISHDHCQSLVAGTGSHGQ